ncbi:unnamed protein product [Symbiodinium necroappetens]|uniref:Uncharacterized protein n=1 Tax=Symbiodinium necroappetens TaxID=1628268 RepID=A0A812V8I3_9DINO|nr:unnamed protein product [Symbiodinium necroappetens]
MLSTSRLCHFTSPYAQKHLPSMAALGFVSAAPPAAPTTPLKAPRSASASTASGLGGTHVLAVSATGGILLAVRRTRQRSAKSRASGARSVACKGQLLDKVEKKEQARGKVPKELEEQPAQAVASTSRVPMLSAVLLLACGVRLGIAKEAPFFEVAEESEPRRCSHSWCETRLQNIADQDRLTWLGFKDPGPVESRLEDLVARLTVEEKRLGLDRHFLCCPSDKASEAVKLRILQLSNDLFGGVPSVDL